MTMPVPPPRPAFLLALILLAVPAAEARRGYVRARDGTVLEGHLRFESNAVLVIHAARGLRARLPLADVDVMGFDAEVEPAPAVPEGAGRPGPLPPSWEGMDVGSAVRAGGADAVGTLVRVRSSGTNVLGDGDSFHFVCKAVSGETELVARLARVQCADPWAGAGLMLRESLAADARHVFLSLSGARGGLLAARERAREDTRVQLFPAAWPPCWLRLRREEDVITAWLSRDGRSWSAAGRFTVDWPQDVLAGLAVAGGRQGQPGLAVFEHVEEAPSVRNRFFVPQVEMVSGSTQNGYIAELDETALRFAGPGRPPVSTPRVALIRFQALPARFAPRLAPGRPGVLLAGGEFVEGDCRRIERGRVTVQSVPLGVRRYDVNREVIAVVLRRKPLLTPRAYEVRTHDGSTWLAQDLAFDASGLVLREPQLGPRRLAWYEILEVRRAA